jgi:putative Mn2+ efflux pump MntP
MPVVGWTVGAVILPYVHAYDHWVAAGVLLALAIKMIWESGKDEQCPRQDASRGMLLIVLALAVSVDALAVGFAMGGLSQVRWLYALIIGLVAAVLTLAGTLVGRHGSRRWGAWAERAGALLLVGVAVKIALLAA